MRAWIEQERDGGLLHAHALAPDRWDLAVSRGWAVDAPGRVPAWRRRYARAIRQDLWRGLQNMRGLLPKVFVRLSESHVHVTAGGVVLDEKTPPNALDRIAELLDNQKKRALWDAYAQGLRGISCSRRY